MAVTEGFGEKLDELRSMLETQKPAMATLQSMAEEIQQVKLGAPTKQVGHESEQLQEAMAEAKRITDEKGIHSPEAHIAWETVEEIAAADNSSAMGGMLTDDECLIDAAMEACQALEELNRVLDLHKDD